MAAQRLDYKKALLEYQKEQEQALESVDVQWLRIDLHSYFASNSDSAWKDGPLRSTGIKCWHSLVQNTPRGSQEHSRNRC